jgi:hypothetical protein
LHFPHHRLLDERCKLLLLALGSCFLTFLEFRQHLARERLQRLTDMIVLILAALLDECDLVDARILETS